MNLPWPELSETTESLPERDSKTWIQQDRMLW